MPYFFILPAYGLLLLVLGAAAFAAWMTPRGRPLGRLLVAGMIGSVPGMLIANVLVTIAGLLPVWLADNLTLPETLKQVLGVCAVAILLLGPFVASALGVLLGFLGGCGFVWWRNNRAPN